VDVKQIGRESSLTLAWISPERAGGFDGRDFFRDVREHAIAPPFADVAAITRSRLWSLGVERRRGAGLVRVDAFAAPARQLIDVMRIGAHPVSGWQALALGFLFGNGRLQWFEVGRSF
jgi:hypothetical protein